MQTRDLTIQGVRSAVHDTGPEEQSEAVVFVHGNPGPMDDWEPLIGPVSRLTRAVALDLPGFGRAARPAHFDYSVEGYARFLGHVIESLRIRRVHLVLHDFGGPWGLQWAVDHPEATASIVLINTGVLRGYRWHALARIWRTPLLGELFQLASTRRTLARVLSRNHPGPLPPTFIERLARYADWGQKRAVLKIYRGVHHPNAVFASAADELAALDPETCVIWGAQDPFIPVQHAARQRETFPRAEVHVLEGIGHWPFVEDPEAVRAIVVPFLARQVRAVRA